MKTISRIFMLALAVTSFSSCDENSSEEVNDTTGAKDVVFSVGIGQSSRASMGNDDRNAVFSSGDAIGVFVGENEAYNNVQYTTDGTLWTGGPIQVGEADVYTYYAYYPYMENASVDNVPMTVSADQEADGFMASDFLYEAMRANAGQLEVAFGMAHSMAMVEVVLEGTAVTENTVVALKNVHTNATLNLKAGEVITGETRGDVIMDNLGGRKYRAFIPAQIVTNGSTIFQLGIDGTVYDVVATSEVTFVKGQYVAFKIKAYQGTTNTTFEITAMGDISVEAPGEVPMPNVDEFPEAIEAADVKKIVNTTANTWCYTTYKTAGDFSVSVEPSEVGGEVIPSWSRQVHIKYTGCNGNSFWKNMLSYFKASPIEIKKKVYDYKLTFKAKGFVKGADGVVLEKDPQFVMCCRNYNDTKGFPIMKTLGEEMKNSQIGVSFKRGDEWQDVVVYFNLSKAVEANPGSNQQFTDSEPVDYSKINIRFYATSGDYKTNTFDVQMTDVKFEPAK